MSISRGRGGAGDLTHLPATETQVQTMDLLEEGGAGGTAEDIGRVTVKDEGVPVTRGRTGTSCVDRRPLRRG